MDFALNLNSYLPWSELLRVYSILLERIPLVFATKQIPIFIGLLQFGVFEKNLFIF